MVLAPVGLFIDGELEWHQRWPLTVKGGYATPYNEEDLLDSDALLPWKVRPMHEHFDKLPLAYP